MIQEDSIFLLYVILLVIIAMNMVTLAILARGQKTIKRQTEKFKNNLMVSFSNFRLLEKRRADQFRLKTAENSKKISKLSNQISSVDHHLYSQLESYLVLSKLLPGNFHGFRGWALSPDAALLLAETIKDYKPRLVVELGSGISTVLIASLIAEYRDSVCISFDHDEMYTEITRHKLQKSGLSEQAKVVKAELTKVSGKAKAYWYNKEILNEHLGSLSNPINLLVIDGPPEGTNKNARLPAAEYFGQYISEDTVVFIDDSNREDEQALIKEFSSGSLINHKLIEYSTEKGTAIFCPEKN